VGLISVEHIQFDKDVVPEYHVIRNITHDGTMMFTQEVLDKALIPLINRTTCCKTSEPEDISKVKWMGYIIGEVELKEEFGMKDLACGRYPGVTDTVTIPVRCVYKFYDNM
jgi:hypothetical protein